MFALSWRGYGLLGLMPPLLAALLASLLAGGGMSSPMFTKTFKILLVVLSIVLWFVGKRLNGDADYDEAPHTFMWLRLQNAGFIYLAIIVFTLFTSK